MVGFWQETEQVKQPELIAAGQQRVLRKGRMSPTKLAKNVQRGRKVQQAKKLDNLTLTQMTGGKDEKSSVHCKLVNSV